MNCCGSMSYSVKPYQNQFLYTPLGQCYPAKWKVGYFMPKEGSCYDSGYYCRNFPNKFRWNNTPYTQYYGGYNAGYTDWRP